MYDCKLMELGERSLWSGWAAGRSFFVVEGGGRMADDGRPGGRGARGGGAPGGGGPAAGRPPAGPHPGAGRQPRSGRGPAVSHRPAHRISAHPRGPVGHILA